MLLEFRASLKRHIYDAILTNSWATMFFSRQLAAIPTLIDFDSTPLQIDRLEAYESPHDVAPLAALKHLLCRRAYGSARLLQAWSNWAKSSAVSDYGVPEDKVVVNPPGVDIDFFRPSTEEEHRDNLRVVFVGGDFRRKGGQLLLDWYRQRSTENVELHLATREPVEQTVPGVTVHSDIRPNSPELLHLYQTSDVFVLPSLGECFGLATVEAMATGLPVVVSDVGGTEDIVQDGTNGFITRAGDVQGLSGALSAVLSDRARRHAMARRSRQLAEERFDARTNALRTLAHLRALAADQPVEGPAI
jgi:glycosyltransferase involved in cell wall biosynthesis